MCSERVRYPGCGLVEEPVRIRRFRGKFVLTGSLDRIDDINKSCLDQFRAHWQCLDNNNHQLWQCRPAEWKLNKCVFENLVGFGSS